MCGVSGILRFNAGESVREDCLRAMSDSLYHRGPDDFGLITAGQVGLAHRRLSIIDLNGGHQPMPNSRRDIWITYNGEIYNYRELRTQLQSMGCEFKTHSDTEVILFAYEVYGESCVEHLRGMFAFAIWDVNQSKLFMARDRLGIKPLYYALSDEQLLFASEIKAIIAANKELAVFNEGVLGEYLATRFVAGAQTFFEGIRKLLPGHTLTWTPQQGIKEYRYWQPPLPGSTDIKMSRQDRVSDIRSSLMDAVQSHLVSDVPVGLFLSGGIDSSTLAAIMAPMTNDKLHSFSVGFSEAHANELDYARLAAKATGTCHHEVVVSPEQYFALLPHLIWHEDEPIAFSSSIPLYVISRMARDHVKVVLTGEGADELFLGYDYRYRVTAWNSRLARPYAAVLPKVVRNAIAASITSLPTQLRRYLERTFLALDANPRDLFFENFSVFRDGLRQTILKEDQDIAPGDPFAEGLRHFHAAGSEILQCMSHADINTYLVELLMKQDQMSMAASLETRVPFLDHHLVEKVAAMPGPEKLKGWHTKALLRDAVADLIPEAILKRPKMGFPVPFGDWLRGKFRPVVDEFVLGPRTLARKYFDADTMKRLVGEHNSGRVNHAERLWLLINFEMWNRIFIDGEYPESIYWDNRRVREVAESIPRQSSSISYA